jgi:signal transduction histidine kinase
MGLRKDKTNTLFWIFLKQLLIFAASILCEIIIFILFIMIGMYHGFLLPANYAEHYLEQNKDKIAQSEPFDKNLIPHICQYGLYDKAGNYSSGDFNKEVQADANRLLKKGESKYYRFFLINRSDGYCIIQYNISAHFASPVLHRLFPKLELELIILFVILFVMIVIFNALFFEKRLKKELMPVLDEIEQIQSRELTIVRKYSKIKEINDILSSLNDMEMALSQSLKKEWETEQKRKTNISALAHDIKTPLTIIKGNTELIMEEDNIVNIYQFAEIINNSSDKIERYIKLLIQETNNNLVEEKDEKFMLSKLIADIITESEAICKTSDIQLIISNTAVDSEVCMNKDKIERAVINLLKNAVEHTTQQKIIKISFESSDYKLSIRIEDFGNGFSEDAFIHAKDQFYTEKTERSEEHYGLGMYFANQVAENYNGCITYYNKPDNTGSVVVFELMITKP